MDKLLKNKGKLIGLIVVSIILIASYQCNAQTEYKYSDKENLVYLSRGYVPHDFFCSGNGIKLPDSKEERLTIPPDSADCICMHYYVKYIRRFYNSDTSVVKLLADFSENKFSKDDTLLRKYFQEFSAYTWKYVIDGCKKDSLSNNILLKTEQITALILLHNYLSGIESSALHIPVKKIQDKYCLYTFTPSEITKWISKNWGSTKHLREQFQKHPPKFSYIYY